MTWTNYVLHFTDGTHYWGRSSNYEARVKAHRNGTGARWVRYKQSQGCDFNAYVLDTYEDNAASHKAERGIKSNGHRRGHCPECRGRTVRQGDKSMTTRVIVFVRDGCATVEMADGPVAVAIVDFDCDDGEEGASEVDGDLAEADLYRFNPSPREDEEAFNRLWAEIEVAAGWRERGED